MEKKNSPCVSEQSLITLIGQVSKEQTLLLFRVGCDKKNFQIINMLPTDINQIEKTLHITKMPVNKRVNALVDANLVKRKRRHGLVEQTELTPHFIHCISSITEKVNQYAIQKITTQKLF